MENHPIKFLIEKIELNYSKELQKYLADIKKKRTIKLYQLISTAKNKEQFQKELIFKKLFAKPYSEKNDYLWRNEIRILKEVLETFLIEIEHQHISKNNEAYNEWLLVQAFDRLKYQDGLCEKQESLLKNKDEFASYNYVMDAQLTKLSNLQHTFADLTKRMEQYPSIIDESVCVLKDLIAMYVARINVSIATYNWMCDGHQNDKAMPYIDSVFSCNLPKNNIANFYNNYSFSLNRNFKKQIDSLQQALKDIEPILKNNKLLEENRVLIHIGLGREFSANGHFFEAHDNFSLIKNEIDQIHQQYKTIFYVNYVTNLVKSKMYKEALFVLENEFSTENLLYKNMLLQSRLLCYLYMRDTQNFSRYISYDLDAAPFPQNYMLKVIKSAYFYLIKEYDTALSIINSLLQAKYAAESMQYYKPISLIYKKLYIVSQNHVLVKKWPEKEIKALSALIDDFENTTTEEVKRVSIFIWIKQEIERINI